jgi:hypothetical protein
MKSGGEPAFLTLSCFDVIVSLFLRGFPGNL